MSLFSRTKKGKRTLVFHIETSHVYAALVEFVEKNGNFIPNIKFSAEAPISVGDELDGSLLTLAMNEAVGEAARTMALSKIGAPDEVVCFLASPWYASQVRTIRSSKNAPFKLNSKLISDLLKKETELFQKEELAEYGDSPDRPLIIERELKQILANGYPIADTHSVSAKEIELSVLFSISPRNILQGVTDAIAASFHTKEIRFHTSMHAGTDILRDFFASHERLLIAEVGGEITDISIMKGSAVSGLLSFPMGEQTFLRSFAKEIKQPVSEARSLLSMYSSGKLEGVLSAKVVKALTKTLRPWTEALEHALSSHIETFLFPHTVLLMTQEDMFTHFGRAIADEGFTQHSFTEKPFNVVPVTDALFRTHIRKTEKAIHRVPITIAALTLARKER